MANSWEWSQKDLDEMYYSYQEEKNKKMLEKLKKRKIPRFSCKITKEEIVALQKKSMFDLPLKEERTLISWVDGVLIVMPNQIMKKDDFKTKMQDKIDNFHKRTNGSY